MAPTDKQKNVIALITKFGEMLRDMPNGQLKKGFQAFVYQLTLGGKSLGDILDMIQKQIDIASSVKHKDMEVNAKSTVKFWETIRDMLVQTHKDNKNES